MDFGAALAALKDGCTVTREGWNGKGMWIALSPGFSLTADRVFTPAVQEEIGENEGVFLPYLIMRTVDGTFVPWLASQTDLLAEDWLDIGE